MERDSGILNFDIERFWIFKDLYFRDCQCRGNLDEVSFDLEPFMKKCQPERLDAWKMGKDWELHPEDPWYVKRCLMDATIRLEREEITPAEYKKLKKNLKRKREVPKWFKERFELDYSEELKFLDVDLTDCIEDSDAAQLQQEIITSPKINSAKRKLLDNPGRDSMHLTGN